MVRHEQKQISRSDPNEVVVALADRCASRKQFERLLAYALAGDRLDYKRSTWFEVRRELRELGIDLEEAA